MNSISTSKLPGRTLGNLALAGSLFLHVGLFVLYSSWQWDWTAPEKVPPKVVTVKFLQTPSSSQSTETSNSPEPTPMVPARPLAIHPNSKVSLIPRTPNLSVPTLQPAKMARQMIRSHRKPIKRQTAQPIFFANTQLFPAVVPANFSQHHQRAVVHRRSPISEVHASKIPDTPAQTAIATGSAEPQSSMIRPLPRPTQSITHSQAGLVSQPAVEQPTSEETVRDEFAALPRELSQSSPADHDAPDADLNGLRGLFTGQVRQRIANAKYYPRMARRRGMEGQPIIAFTLGKGGRLMAVDLAQTSGYQLLDQAALAAVHQAAPYPEIPPELKTDTFQFKLPISFVLK